MPHPLLYEINTRCWLRELSEKCERSLTLANVPEAEVAGWQKLGFTHIWLMGVWTSGPLAREKALADANLQRAYNEVLGTWRPEDVGASPYAIAEYRVSPGLGGELGLQNFRRQLHQQGLKLLLDFVPNHVGLDWPMDEPQEMFVQSPSEAPETFPRKTRAGIRWLAHGKDPNFPAWTDTIQLDYRRLATRTRMTQVLQSIARRCDGVRCDMAMLLLNDVFAKTWEKFPIADSAPATEFWAEAISTIKQADPDFLFLAEVYWGLEPRLQALGFDYTYDKVLYDRLVCRDAPGVQRHLFEKSPGFIGASAHFLENHDEPRIASILSTTEHRAAALLILGLPGMRFLHEGQLTGARRKIPVQLLRRPVEPADEQIERMYRELLLALPASAVGQGMAEVLRPVAGLPENPTSRNFVIVQWRVEPGKIDLVVINLGPQPGRCSVRLNLGGCSSRQWSIKDLLRPARFEHSAHELENSGLCLELPAHGAQLLHFEPVR